MSTLRLVLVALVLFACGGPRIQDGSSPKPQRDLLTREEIQESTGRDLDLYQAIRSLRPHFLEPPPGVRSRGSRASMPTAVYINRIRQAGLEALRSISASSIEEVRYLTPTASQNEFGPSASGGAVLVQLIKPSP